MSSETITRNDIVAILNKTIPGQGTDMSAQGVEDFIEDLNLAPSDYVKLSELGDYVVEQGTDGSWTYTKWNSGKYEASVTTQFAIGAGTAWQGGYYHATTYALPLPSFALTWHMKSAVKNDAVLAYFVGVASSSSGLTFYWANGASGSGTGAQFGYATIVIEGTWK